jgi:4-hydroxybenzoate polyprenyltransferase
MQTLMLALLGWIGVLADLAAPYFVALLIVALLFARQLWSTRERARAKCFKAFLDNNYVGLAIFVGIALATLQH